MGGFWGEIPPKTISFIFIYIGVPYPQLLLNYPLDNCETWLDCSLGCVYVHSVKELKTYSFFKRWLLVNYTLGTSTVLGKINYISDIFMSLFVSLLSFRREETDEGRHSSAGDGNRPGVRDWRWEVHVFIMLNIMVTVWTLTLNMVQQWICFHFWVKSIRIWIVKWSLSMWQWSWSLIL